MSKQIIIVGGGLSGLSVLHYLKKKYIGRDDVQIRLIEQGDHVGGTARTEMRDLYCFEFGPNGFLDTSTSTVDLAKDLGLNAQIIRADPSAKKRFISVNRTLFKLPTQPLGIFQFKLFAFFDKLRIFLEPFIRKGRNEDETLFDFGVRRFGEAAAKCFFDPMAAGIFGGDAQKLSMKEAFPRIYEMEQKHGSVFWGMIRRKRVAGSPNGPQKGQSRLLSFKKGMQQLADAAWERYREVIHLGETVKRIDRAGEGFSIETEKVKYFADELFLCTPSYVAAELLQDLDRVLAEFLGKVHYAPIAVVGLVYEKSQVRNMPQGFGYLVPSSEESHILGVLFPGNIFSGRCGADHFMFRVMIGGRRDPDILQKREETLVSIACDEVKAMFGVEQAPIEQFLKCWRKGIPQYDTEYAYSKEGILYALEKFKSFHLVANYLGGISVNDCTENARKAAEKSKL